MDKTRKNADGNVIDSVIRQADKALENVRAKGAEYWKDAKDKRDDLLNDARSMGKKTWGSATGFVHDHPVKTIGFAVLLGFIAGTYLNSRRKN